MRRGVVGGGLVLALLLLTAEAAHAHGAAFKDPSDSPKRSARPSPLAPAPPGVTTEQARGLPPVWKPEGWYRWWELNAIGLTPRPAAQAAPKPSVTTPSLEGPASGGDPEKAALLAHLMKLADPNGETERRLLAAALVTMGRLATDERPLFLLKRWAVNRKAGAQIRDAALVGLGLLRRDKRVQRIAPIHLRSLRSFLLERADDSEETVRTRAYALFALGLHADQGYQDTALTKDGRDITRALWQRVPTSTTSAELSCALLTAIGMQPPAGVPAGVVDGLKAIGLGERVQGRVWNPFERSHAITALARLGKAGTDAYLLRLTGNVKLHPAIRCAAALGILRRAPSMEAPTRSAAERILERVADAPGTHWLVTGLQKMALGRLLGADMQAGSDWSPEKARMARGLRKAALEGRREERPFCGIAIALGGHAQDSKADHVVDYLFFSKRTARRGLASAGRSDRMLGAFAIALGLMQDEEALPQLHDVLRDRARDGVLRGHCALALGLIGPADLANETCLLAATRERTHIFLHLQAARALGLLGYPEAMDKLRRRFDASENAMVTSGLALGLATLGNRLAVDSLWTRLKDPKQALGVQVNCCIALGVLLDPQPGSTAARMTVHANYTALTGAHKRFLDLL